MSSESGNIQAVPTNIITGFLGVGKTSAILHLLKCKPNDERWAVLINEFGEIGVDGSVVAGQHSTDEGIFIREVPGGCMCCAAGLPMQTALNQLLAKAKPDHLLIEPTGLGHPKEVLQALSMEYYQEVLCLQKTITLVDARNLSDSRYTQHETFNQQIAIADTVVGNKLDLYQDTDKANLIAYVKQRGQTNTRVIFTQHGEIPFSALQGSTSSSYQASLPHHHASGSKPLVSEADIPACGFLKAINEGEGYKSIGWRFSPHKVFQREKLLVFLTGLQVERMKAVFITEAGFFAYNLANDTLTEIGLDECLESRIEIISDSLDDALEPQLMACIAD